MKPFSDLNQKTSNNALGIPGVSCSIEDLIGLKRYAGKLRKLNKSTTKSPMSGGHISRLRGRGIDFDEVRLYQPGDEQRSIDWRVTARTGKLHTKIFREEKERPVFIVLDQRQSMFFGSSLNFKSVVAAQCASLIAWSVIQKGDRLGGLIFSDTQHQELKPKPGKKGVLNFINTTVNFNQELVNQNDSKIKVKLNTDTTKENLSSVLYKLKQIVRPGSIIYLISDFDQFDNDADQQLALIARHNDIIPLFVVDPLEKQLPQAGTYAFGSRKAFHEEHKTEVTEISTTSKQLQLQYEQKFIMKKEMLEAKLILHGIGLTEISTNVPAFEQLGL